MKCEVLLLSPSLFASRMINLWGTESNADIDCNDRTWVFELASFASDDTGRNENQTFLCAQAGAKAGLCRVEGASRLQEPFHASGYHPFHGFANAGSHLDGSVIADVSLGLPWLGNGSYGGMFPVSWKLPCAPDMIDTF